MAGIARRNCAAYPNVTIEQAEFERWRPGGTRFRLCISRPGLALDRARGARTCRAAALVDGGALAVFWNRPDWSASDLREELGEAYRRPAAPATPTIR